MSLISVSVLAYAKQVSLLDLVRAYYENPIIKDALDRCEYFQKEAWDKPKQELIDVLNCEDFPFFLWERADTDKIFDKYFSTHDEVTIPRRFFYK